jgi:hypothetical protein
VFLFGFVLARRLGQRRFRDAIVATVPFVLLVGGHLAWRYAYYGSAVPNTAQAKVGLSMDQITRGVWYLANFGRSYWPLLVPLALAVKPRSPGAWLGAFVATYSAYIVAVGGDHFVMHRFFAPLLPVICLLCAAGLVEAANKARHGLVLPVLVAATCAGALLPSFGRQLAIIRHDGRDVERWSELGRWLRDNLPPGEFVALNPVGAVGYYSGRGVIDMLGINDAHIARAPAMLGKGPAGHERADGAYVLSRRPALIFLGVVHPVAGTRPRLEPIYPSDRQILLDPRSRSLYVAGIIKIGDLRFVALKRRAD